MAAAPITIVVGQVCSMVTARSLKQQPLPIVDSSLVSGDLNNFLVLGIDGNVYAVAGRRGGFSGSRAAPAPHSFLIFYPPYHLAVFAPSFGRRYALRLPHLLLSSAFRYLPLSPLRLDSVVLTPA